MAEQWKIRNRVRKIKKFQRKSSSEDDNEDLIYTVKCKGLLPSRTTQWDLACLHSLGIFYSDKSTPLSDLLDSVYSNIGVFKPLTEKEKEYTTSIQDSLDFSFSTQEMIDYCRKYMISPNEVNLNVAEKVRSNLESDMFTKTRDTLRPYTVGLIEQFIRNVHHIIQIMRCKQGLLNVPERVFVNLFCNFVKMCNLNPSEGSLWKTDQNLLQQKVSSEAGVVILPCNLMEANDYQAVNVVSVVDVIKLSTENLDTSESLSSSSLSESSDINREHSACQPSIYRRVCKKLLGQHGAELVVHHELFGEKCIKNGKIYLSGMIVVGTQVTFTLLVCSVDHMVDILNEKDVRSKRSCISYSEPKDLLIKKDRDELLEAFWRLNYATV
ncbi:uncharacterized protein LOC127708085 [Mytilus californianus]|uniref:uncharacterized protein LOC127708085 n=1 Tax=Mytilus californianus TaxID=6549 RepID=UPI00224568D8|nr:uncharacterized protein LOC127708085 [Mytilus californianus]